MRAMWFVCSVVAGLLFVNQAHADKQFDAWSFGESEGRSGMYIGTENDSGGSLVKYCFYDSAKCIWGMNVSTSCSVGAETPVLLNSESGTDALAVVCAKSTAEGGSFAFTDLAAIDSAIKAASPGRLGIAYPLKDGRFGVSRYLLDGWARAQSAMEREFSAIRKSRAAKITSDQAL